MGTSSSIVTVSGLRVSASIVKSGGAGMGQAMLRIFGLSPDLMAQLSTYGAPVDALNGVSVQINAGDAQGGMPIVFVGTVQTAAADYNQMPDVAFVITAFEGLTAAIQLAKPTTINGFADAAQIMSQLARTMGYAFENNGVNVKLDCPYFPGTARMQAQECAEAGNFNWIIDNGTLAIWPRGGARSGDAVLVSADTGMIGYPTFTYKGVIVRTLLNAAIRYGSKINVQSTLKQATGIWAVIQMTYELESETPDGAWFLTMTALAPDYVATSNAPPSS